MIKKLVLFFQKLFQSEPSQQLTMDPKNYVRGLSLPVQDDNMPVIQIATRSLGPEDNTDVSESFVNNQSIVSFVAGVSEQNRQDILNSTLLAQLAADKTTENVDDLKAWYKQYTEVLTNIGWVIEQNEFTDFQSGSDEFEMNTAIMGIMGAVVDPTQISLITKTLESVKSLGDDDKRIKVFERKFKRSNKGNFQIGVANETGGTVSFGVGAFLMDTKESTGRFLFFKTGKARTKLTYSGMRCTLNPQVYSQVRDSILEKLGRAPKVFIAKLPDLGDIDLDI